MQMDKDIILEFKNITKHYPGVIALNNVCLKLKRGEIHALAGENGAGKSTLIKTCTGAIRPTSGQIIVNGHSYDALTPALAGQEGIGVIYQEFTLVNELTAYENIFLGRELKRKAGFVDNKAMITRTKELFRELNINIDPLTKVEKLTVGYQQMVEIAKAVAKDIRILIMDEPSAPLTNQEVETMFQMIERLRKKGITILYISHRLDELFRICDRVTVLRDGNYIMTTDMKDIGRDELIHQMVGRTLKETFPAREIRRDSPVALELRKVSGNGVSDISLKVRKGEILGLGGLIGAGRTELAELIFGVKALQSGEIYKNGEKLNIRNPKEAIKHGISLVPEDRKRQGANMQMTIRENITMAILPRISRVGWVNRKQEKKIVQSMKENLKIKTPSLEQTVENLSGGNQQKVILGKWLSTNPDIIIFDEPTRGIDVGAKQEIYGLMDELKGAGKAIIMISSDMEELLGMSDRIAILNKGKISGILQKNEFSQERVLYYGSKNTEGSNRDGEGKTVD